MAAGEGGAGVRIRFCSERSREVAVHHPWVTQGQGGRAVSADGAAVTPYTAGEMEQMARRVPSNIKHSTIALHPKWCYGSGQRCASVCSLAYSSE